MAPFAVKNGVGLKKKRQRGAIGSIPGAERLLGRGALHLHPWRRNQTHHTFTTAC